MSKELEDIKAIREMMERSSKFVSLSGWSGIMAGITSLIGVFLAYLFVDEPAYIFWDSKFGIEFDMLVSLWPSSGGGWGMDFNTPVLITIACGVLLISLVFGFFFSYRKAKKNKQQLFSKVALRAVYNLAIPLITGGILCLYFIYQDQLIMAVPLTLIFYGLALLNASKYTYEEIHYLGLIEIGLGLMAGWCIFVLERLTESLFFWGLGFGVCHIIYGTVMYLKYDRKK